MTTGLEEQLQRVSVAGVEIRYLRTGHRTPIVLLHTLRTQLEYFGPLIEHLDTGRLEILAIDLPGHGESSAPAVDYTAGPIARNVTDAAVLLGAATGVDPNDAATAAQAGHAFTDYTQFLNDKALNGARIGVWRAGTYDPGLVGSVVEPILDHVITALRAQGATVIDPTDIDLSATAHEFDALLCEFKTDIATYLQTYVHGTNPVSGQAYPQTLADLIAFDQAHPALEGPWNDLVFQLAEATQGRNGHCAELRKKTTPPVQDAINNLMAANHLDAIIALTNGPAWPTNDNPNEGDLNGHFEYFVGSSTAAAVSGYPDITVPAGYDAGLPLGITFIGGRWAEPKLLGLAYDYEQATHIRVPPQFIPTIGDALFPGVPNPPAQARRLQATQGHRHLVVRFR